MSRRKKLLSHEDRMLWDQIRSTVTPLSGISALEDWLDHAAEAEPVSLKPKPPAFPAGQGPARAYLPPYLPPVSSTAQQASPSIDDVTARKLRKGRLEIDARIDLHGMSEKAARDTLLRFAENCHRQGVRIILVITGKGRAGQGVLRRSVPLWFNEDAFIRLIGGYRVAHLTHGGEGALYVRIRKDRQNSGRSP